MLCRHCNRVPSNRPRGLCGACYYTSGVRDLYPIDFAAHGTRRSEVGADFNGPGGEPEPTDCLPGTPEKVAVLVERAMRQQRLWHKLDARGG